jgi:hypothetical protein
MADGRKPLAGISLGTGTHTSEIFIQIHHFSYLMFVLKLLYKPSIKALLSTF